MDNAAGTDSDQVVAHGEPSSALVNTSSLFECERYFDELTRARRTWLDNHEHQWDRYLEEGYSLNEVTLAMARFIHPNIAASFHVEKLRWNSEVAVYNRAINQQAQEEVEGYEASGFSLQRGIPLPPLDSFELRAEPEKRQLLEELPVNIDDVAYFIYSGLPLDDIKMMLDSIDSLQTVVNYDRYNIVSLFNYAVVASRPEVLEELLRRGMRPTEDDFLGTSMDWALFSLQSRQNEYKNDAVEVVKALIDLGAGARLKVNTSTKLEGTFIGWAYRFDETSLSTLFDEYQLDLTQIQPVTTPQLDVNHPILEELSANLEEHMLEVLGTRDFNSLTDECWETRARTSQQWETQSPYEVYLEATQGQLTSSEHIISLLSGIDPALVDWYRNYNDRQKRAGSVVMIPSEIRGMLRARRFEEAINNLGLNQYNESERRSLIQQLIGYGPNATAALMNNPFGPTDIYYSDFIVGLRNPSIVQAYEDVGVNLKEVDEFQKTFLFYAAERMNSDLVTYLLEQGYPYSFDEFGQDPLHAALREGAERGNVSKMEQIVEALMESEPEINDFHRGRLAVIRLKYPRIYERLANRYPQLMIDEDTPLPVIQ